MRFPARKSESGIALVMVMIVIVALGVLAGGFAYSMRVETKLARNAQFEPELEWLGRSGVELGRYVLAMHLVNPDEGRYDALNQKWAGGEGLTNDIIQDIVLTDVELGAGKFSVKITDLERKFNINMADETILENALNMVGADASERDGIIAAILDWRDTDSNVRLNGAESDDYLGMNPSSPYYAKNGPIEDISELLLIRGITPEMYWGPKLNGNSDPANAMLSNPNLGALNQGLMAVGLVDLFTPFSSGQININTAAPEVLMLIPGIDEGIAQSIASERQRYPFENTGFLASVPGMSPPLISALGNRVTVRSQTFEIEVTASAGKYTRNYIGIVRRNNQREVPLIMFYWK